MNILYINHYAGSPMNGMEFRPFYLGKEWRKSGHNVSILAASFSHLRQKNPKVSKDLMGDDVEGLYYCWLKTPTYVGNGFGRLINIFTFVFKLFLYAFRISKKFKPDIIIASSTYPLDVIPSYVIAKISKAKVIHEVHDLWPLTLIEIGGISRWNPVIMLMQWAENFSYRRVDRVVSMLEVALPYMKEHGLTDDRYVVVSNGIVESDWENVQDEVVPKSLRELCEEARAKGHFILGYAGYLGAANSVGTLIEAMAILKKERVTLILLGHGPEKETLSARVRDLELESIHFYGTVLKEQIPAFLRFVDATFIGAPNSQLYRFGVSPNKLLDYLMAGKPVLYAIEAGNNWVKESGAGLSVKPESPIELAEAIKKLISMPEVERNRMGLSGREFVLKNKTYSHLARRFLEGLAN